MGKRTKGMRRSFPKRFASDNIQAKSGKGKTPRVDWAPRLERGLVRAWNDPKLEPGVELVDKGNRLERAPLIETVEWTHPRKQRQDPIPPTRKEQSPGVFGNNPRFLVRHKLKAWQGLRHHGIDDYIRGRCLSEWKGITTYLWFSGNKFLIIKKGETFEATSCVYNGKDAAIHAFNYDRIVWEEVKETKK
jgi:hypothetical protein